MEEVSQEEMRGRIETGRTLLHKVFDVIGQTATSCRQPDDLVLADDVTRGSLYG